MIYMFNKRTAQSIEIEKNRKEGDVILYLSRETPEYENFRMPFIDTNLERKVDTATQITETESIVYNSPISSDKSYVKNVSDEEI